MFLAPHPILYQSAWSADVWGPEPVEVFLEAIMMACVPWLMKKIGSARPCWSELPSWLSDRGCGLVTNRSAFRIKLLHAPETACFALGLFRYFTLHFDTKVSATLYMVGYRLPPRLVKSSSTPLGDLRITSVTVTPFLVISNTLIAGIYAPLPEEGRRGRQRSTAELKLHFKKPNSCRKYPQLFFYILFSIVPTTGSPFSTCLPWGDF